MIKQIALCLTIFFCTFTFGVERIAFPKVSIACRISEPINDCKIKQLRAEINSMSRVLVKEITDLKNTMTEANHMIKYQKVSIEKNSQTIKRLKRTIQRLSRLAHSHSRNNIPPGDYDYDENEVDSPTPEELDPENSDEGNRGQPRSSGIH